MGVFDPDRHDNLLGITDIEKLNELEAFGVLRAQEHMLDLDISDLIFDTRLILDIHHIVFGSIYEWAAKWRDQITNIGIDPVKIPYAMIEYADQVNYLKDNIKDKQDLVDCLTYTHHRYTQIHPFNNGNGRTARLLTDLIANVNGYQNIQLYVMESGTARNEYKAALREADNFNFEILKDLIGGKLFPFVGQ